MSENKEGIQRVQIHSSFGDPLDSHVQFHAQIQPFSSNFNVENSSKRVGMPPAHPQIPVTSSLPPLSPSSYWGPASDQVEGNVSLPPRKTHRRSNSDIIPFGFSTILQSSPPLIPLRNNVKQESNWEKTCGEVVDDWSCCYVNLNNLGKLNSFRIENSEDLKANGGDCSDNEATSSNNNMQKSGICSVITDKRHYRSVSMDSAMGGINFVDESVKLLPSRGGQIGKLLSSGLDTFSLEFGNGVFNGVELKKIMASENLAEMALTDPKRVKRILANRQSAARSKERKMRYITELENKVQTLQTEATTLSAQVTLLQRDLTSLTSQNTELKFHVQATEQQAHLRDALNDTLTAEVQRLKIMRMELSADATNFSELSINPQMFKLHHQQEDGEEQNGGTTTHE